MPTSVARPASAVTASSAPAPRSSFSNSAMPLSRRGWRGCQPERPGSNGCSHGRLAPVTTANGIWLWHKDRDAGDYGYGELLDVAVAIP